MRLFFENLKERNEALFYFGLICFILAAAFLVLRFFTATQVMHVNAWIKPFKFALSIALYAWTMAWYCAYLRDFNTGLFNYTVIILLGFEIVYIAIQAARGQLSHFNLSTPVYATLYSLMAIAASLVTIYTAYIGILFMKQDFPGLPDYYVWSIRIGILIFVVFSFEGFVMGSRLSHTIGGPDGGPGLPLLNWSRTFGDPRVAHFIGMHALQLIPLISYYLLKNTKLTFVLGVLYAALAVYTLIQALQGKPFIKN
jgi:hypothetical protein